MRVTFKTLEQILEENPEYIITPGGVLKTKEQAGTCNCIFNEVWVEKLGTTCDISCYTAHQHMNLIEKVFEEEFIDKTKEALRSMRQQLENKDLIGVKHHLDQLQIHIGNLTSKIRDKDKYIKGYHKNNNKLLQERNDAENINRVRADKIRELEKECNRLHKIIGVRKDTDDNMVLARKFSKIVKDRDGYKKKN